MDVRPGPLLFFAILAAIVGYFLYRVLRHGGFKAALCGARIERTVGEVPGKIPGTSRAVLRVHALRRDGSEKLIGLEIVAKSLVSYEMTPITLSVDQAQRLASLLENATSTP